MPSFKKMPIPQTNARGHVFKIGPGRPSIYLSPAFIPGPVFN